MPTPLNAPPFQQACEWTLYHPPLPHKGLLKCQDKTTWWFGERVCGAILYRLSCENHCLSAQPHFFTSASLFCLLGAHSTLWPLPLTVRAQCVLSKPLSVSPPAGPAVKGLPQHHERHTVRASYHSTDATSTRGCLELAMDFLNSAGGIKPFRQEDDSIQEEEGSNSVDDILHYLDAEEREKSTFYRLYERSPKTAGEQWGNTKYEDWREGGLMSTLQLMRKQKWNRKQYWLMCRMERLASGSWPDPRDRNHKY